MKFAVALALTLRALAQDMPELRGTVTEFGTGAAIVDAEVILYEFVTVDGLYTRKHAATVVTDARGAFTLKPEHPGPFFSEAKKLTYLTAEELDSLGPIPGTQLAEISLTLTREAAPEIHFILIRPGGITGRVIDEEGRPVPNFPVQARSVGATPVSTRGVTDRDGVFLLPKVIPVPRLIRVGPANELPVTRPFKKDELDRVEQDVEITYWPGGVSDPALGLPMDVVPGVVANVGTIRLRTAAYYQAHLTYAGECSARQPWVFSKPKAQGIMMGQCAKDIVLDKLLPGDHTFFVSGPGWAVLQFRIDHENVEVPLTFTPPTEVAGRFTGVNGDAGLPRVGLRSQFDPRKAPDFVRAYAKGEFVIPNVIWPAHQVQVQELAPGLAIREIRYAGIPVPDGIITLVPGAQLEVALDDQPGSISGTAPPQYTVHLTGPPGIQFTARADAAGKFQLGSLTAGEYRAIAVPAPLDGQVLSNALAAAPRVTLARGEEKSIELKSR